MKITSMTCVADASDTLVITRQSSALEDRRIRLPASSLCSSTKTQASWETRTAPKGVPGAGWAADEKSTRVMCATPGELPHDDAVLTRSPSTTNLSQ